MLETLHGTIKNYAGLSFEICQGLLKRANILGSGRKDLEQFTGRIALIGDSCISSYLAEQAVETLVKRKVVTSEEPVIVQPVILANKPTINTRPHKAASTLGSLLNERFVDLEIELADEFQLDPASVGDTTYIIDNLNLSPDSSNILVISPLLARRLFGENCDYRTLASGGVTVFENRSGAVDESIWKAYG